MIFGAGSDEAELELMTVTGRYESASAFGFDCSLSPLGEAKSGLLFSEMLALAFESDFSLFLSNEVSTDSSVLLVCALLLFLWSLLARKSDHCQIHLNPMFPTLCSLLSRWIKHSLNNLVERITMKRFSIYLVE